MRIGYEAKRLFASMTGFGVYNRLVVAHLAKRFPENTYTLFTPSGSEHEEVLRVLQHESVEVINRPHKSSKYFSLLLTLKYLRDAKLDIFHCLSQQMPNAVKLLSIPKIVTVHDLIYRYFPPSGKTTKELAKHHSQIAGSCKNATRIITVSENTKRDLVEAFKISPKKVSVIHPICDDRYWVRWSDESLIKLQKKYSLPGNYVLYVGTLSKRKNLLAVVKGIEYLPAKRRPKLVVVGRSTSYSDSIVKYVEEKGLDSYIYFLRNVTTYELPGIYQLATLFCYPSLYEGFGIPVVEALCSGIPVITSNISSLPEAAGPNSFLIDPNNPEEISAAIDETVNDTVGTNVRIRKGYEYATRFKGDVLALDLMNLYQLEIDSYKRWYQ